MSLMRTATILLGAAMLSVAAACSKIETKVELQTRRVEFKLSSENMPGSKIFFQEDGGKLVRRWNVGDEVSVFFYYNETSYVETFQLVGGQGTTTGTFARENSELPMTGTVYVDILYPQVSDNGSDWLYRSIKKQYGYLDGSCDLLFFSGCMQDGVYVPFKASSQVFYLHIPQGTKLLDGMEGEKYVNVEFSAREGTCLRNELLYHKEQMGSYEEGEVNVYEVYLVDGALGNDFFVTLSTPGDPGESFNMKIIDGYDESRNCTYVLSRGEDKYLYAGTMYHLNQSHFTPILSF